MVYIRDLSHSYPEGATEGGRDNSDMNSSSSSYIPVYADFCMWQIVK
jgi:hypothetical protein